jgi:chromosomal replication initiator protein
MLLVDDIHFISGKGQTEESFYHTFDELHNTDRQIVITSNCPPKAMCLLPERLRSRFEWGLVADIQPPDVETRLAILQTKAEHKKIEIPIDVLEFIAQRVHQNIRELEGALNRVIAYAKLVRTSPTLKIAARALENIASKQPKTTAITPESILEAVASSFQIMPVDLKGRKKDKETALARQTAMYLIKQATKCSLVQVGQALGNKNPSTVSHACEKIAIAYNSSPYLRRKILDIQQKIYATATK